MPIRAVVCDIEGTTSSISFVHKVLFPLSLERLESFLDDNVSSAEVAEQLAAFSSRLNLKTRKEVIETLQNYIRADNKDTTLKWLQGRIWKQAFEAGIVKGHVYAEVADSLRLWKNSGKKIFIYSSGSVEAQGLLFRYSEAGDLTGFIDGYFDTTTGMKREPDSYAKIAKAIQVPVHEALFLSDIQEELRAATEVGMKTCLLLRDAVAIPAGYAGESARDFTEVGARFF